MKLGSLFMALAIISAAAVAEEQKVASADKTMAEASGKHQEARPNYKQKEYAQPAPIQDIDWALKFDQNHDGKLDDAEKAALEEAWKTRQQKQSEFKQWAQEFQERMSREEREMMQLHEKERQEFREKMRQEYIKAREQFGLPPPPAEEKPHGWNPEKKPYTKGEPTKTDKPKAPPMEE